MTVILVDLDSDDTMLVLLGDYIHGHDSYAVLDRVMGLEQKYGREKIVALMGNHEEAVLFGADKISDYDDVDRPDRDDDIYLKWMEKLRLYYRKEKFQAELRRIAIRSNSLMNIFTKDSAVRYIR